MTELSEAVERLLWVLIDWEAKPRPPSYEDLRVALGLKSDSSIAAHLATLEEGGYIVRLGGSRGILVLKNPDGSARTGFDDERRAFVEEQARRMNEVIQSSYELVGRGVPLNIVGHVAAGPFALAAEDVEPRPLLFFASEIVADTVTLEADDPAHNARAGDVVIRELRPPRPGDEWIVGDFPVVGLYRRFEGRK